MSLESVDDVESGDSLTLSVFSVGDRVSDDVLEEDLEDTTGFFVDETGDTLDTTTTSETTNSWLGNTLGSCYKETFVENTSTHLNVVSENLTVTLSAALS